MNENILGGSGVLIRTFQNTMEHDTKNLDPIRKVYTK